MSNYLGNQILEALEAKTSSLSSSCQRVLGISSSRRRLEEEDDEEDDDDPSSSSGQLFELNVDWSNPDSLMAKQDEILALEMEIDKDQDIMQESLDGLTLAMDQVLEKLDIDQANKKKKPKAPKKPKHAKASETQEEEAQEDTDLFKRNLLAVEEVVNDKFDNMKSQVKLVQSKVESQGKSVESKVESIESKVESMEVKVEAMEGKMESMEKSIDDIKDMLSQLLTAGGAVE